MLLRSSSRKRWIMTCLKVWAAMRPKASGLRSMGSPWRNSVISPVIWSSVQVNSSASRVLKCFLAALTIACSRSDTRSDLSMFRSRAIESRIRIISWVFTLLSPSAGFSG